VNCRQESGGGLAAAKQWIGGAKVVPGWRRKGGALATRKRELSGGGKAVDRRCAIGGRPAAARRGVRGVKKGTG